MNTSGKQEIKGKVFRWVAALAMVLMLVPIKDVSVNAATGGSMSISGTRNVSELPDNGKITLTGKTTIVMDTDKTLQSIEGAFDLIIQGNDKKLTVKNTEDTAIKVKSLSATECDFDVYGAAYGVLADGGDVSISGKTISVKSTANDAIKSSKKVNITGGVSVESGDNGICGQDVTINGGVVVKAFEYGIWGKNKVVIKTNNDADVRIDSVSNDGVYAGSSITEYVRTGGDITIDAGIRDIWITAMRVSARAEYGSVNISGKKIWLASESQTCILSEDENAVVIAGDDITIKTSDAFHIERFPRYAIYGGQVKITGQISVEAKNDGGIYGQNVTINGGVNIKAGDDGIWAKDKVVIKTNDDADVRIVTENGRGIYGGPSISEFVHTGGDITIDAGAGDIEITALWESVCSKYGDISISGKKIALVTGLGYTIEGEAVKITGQIHVKSNKGIYGQDVTINGGVDVRTAFVGIWARNEVIIETNGAPLKIVTEKDRGIYAGPRYGETDAAAGDDITIDVGDGVMTIDAYDAGIFAKGGNISINGGELDVSSKESFGMYSTKNITFMTGVTRAKVSSPMASAIYADKVLTIDPPLVIVTPENGVISADRHTIINDGADVATEVEIQNNPIPGTISLAGAVYYPGDSLVVNTDGVPENAYVIWQRRRVEETTWHTVERKSSLGSYLIAPGDHSYLFRAIVRASGYYGELESNSVTIRPIYQVTFDLNGHGSGETPASQTVRSGGMATEPTAPSEAHWVFGGWYTTADCIDPAYDFSKKVGADFTLYAKWTKETHTVSFANTGSAVSIPAQTVEYGNPAVKPATDPTMSGYEFAGWYMGNSLDSGKYDFSTPVTKDITLWALWNKVVTVSFDANGGTGSMEPISVTERSRFTLPENGFTKDGARFSKWNVIVTHDGMSSGSYKDPGATVYVDAGDTVVVKAVWDGIIMRTVQFDVREKGTAPADMQVENNTAITGLPYLSDVDGFKFTGWYPNAQAAVNGVGEVENGTIITSDMTLYAGWSSTKLYRINVKYAGEGSGTVVLNKYTSGKNTHISIVSVVPDANSTYEGFTRSWSSADITKAGSFSTPYGEPNATVQDIYVTFYFASDHAHNISELDDTTKWTHHELVRATCTENGMLEYYSCNTCGGKFFKSGSLLTRKTDEELVLPAAHDLEHHASAVATCSQEGNEEYWKCQSCGKIFEADATSELAEVPVIPIDVNAHSWGMVQYIWSNDNKEVVAQIVCSHNQDHVLKETVSTVETVGTVPSCETTGTSDFVANFTNPAFTMQTRYGMTTAATGHAFPLIYHEGVDATCTTDGSIEYWECSVCHKKFRDESGSNAVSDAQIVLHDADAHDWDETVYEWNADYSKVTATRTCKNDPSHVETETVNTTETIIENPTCDQSGYKKFVTDAFNNSAFVKQTRYELIDALEHDWNTPVYTWAEDYSIVTAKRTCSKADHPETEIVTPYYEVLTPATCTTSGTGRYTAEFASDGFTTQIKEVTIPALNHSWNDEIVYTWSDDNLSVTATRTCEYDDDHTETETVNTTSSEKQPATCKAKGTTTYTATFTKAWAATQTKDVEDIPVSNAHVLSEVAEVAANCATGTAGTKAHWKCTVCDKLFSDAAGTTEVTAESLVLPAKHTLLDHAAKPATCKAAGNIEYWECSACHAKFSDKDGENAVADVSLPIDPTAHKWGAWTEVTPATETTEGLERRICTLDPTHKEEQNISVLTHTHGGTNATAHAAVAATCKDAGNSAYYECSCGKFYSDAACTTEIAENSWVIPATNSHTLTKTEAADATCEADGHAAYWTCSVCGKLFADEAGTQETTLNDLKVAALDHDWNTPTYIWAEDNTSVTASTTCKRNGSHVLTETVSTSSSSTAATCDEAGETTYEVVFTKAPFTKQTKTVTVGTKLGHDWGEPVYTWAEDNTSVTATRTCTWNAAHKETETVTVTVSEETPATCSAVGAKKLTASFTNKAFATQTKTVEVSKAAHTPGTAVKENEVAATCTTAGGYDEVVYCTECQTLLSKTHHTVAALGHDWNEWDITVPATETADGLKTHTCKRNANHVETQVIPASGGSHVHAEHLTHVDAADAGCTAAGHIAYYECTCGKYFADAEGTQEITDVVIPATEHTEGEAVRENEVPATCTAEGSYDEVISCTVCQTELSRIYKTIGKTAHTADDPVHENEVPATCTAGGSYDEVIYCKDCHTELSRTPRTLEKLAHSWSEWTVTREESCTEAGEKKRTCSGCTDVEVQSIPATGHTAGEAVYENLTPATRETAGGYDEVIYCTDCNTELSRVHKTIEKLVDDSFAYYTETGAGAKWKQGSSEVIKAVIKRTVNDSETFRHFLGIRVDGKDVDKSNYTAVSGSVVITLKDSFLNTLSVGEHVMTILFDDGSEDVKFTVEEKDGESSADSGNGGSNSGSTDRSSS
ncbi:MAG: InlB B-repeat-containing protein, partial [Lachnospiraceae bacterium]|nr:InlB B-repeat-containing protein [Lachnospiraceae bacterium]